METTSDNQIFLSGRARRPVRMAYAINNRQPVRCTIVSDQPLFYMDYEGDIEDEAAFEDQPAEARIAPLETPQAATGTMALEGFMADMAFATSDMGPGAAGHDHAFEAASIQKTLQRSRFASALLESLTRHGGKLVMNGQVETAVYDRVSGTVQINPSLPRVEQILLAARELRRVWQHRSGALVDPLNFHPDQAILVNRAQVADLAAGMIRIAWELQLTGEKECWQRIEDSTMNDLARAFAREAFNDFRTVSNGTANCAVFETWFLSERCRQEDRRLVQQMLADYQGYVFDGAGASRSAVTELVTAIGSMPFGKNYLAPYINTIVGEALFTEVRDRSNANFLWFIKFERSFRETEHELQSGADLPGRDAGRGSSPSLEERSAIHEKTAQIVALPRNKNDAALEPRAAQHAGGSGRVIQFRGRHGRGPSRP